MYPSPVILTAKRGEVVFLRCNKLNQNNNKLSYEQPFAYLNTEEL